MPLAETKSSFGENGNFVLPSPTPLTPPSTGRDLPKSDPTTIPTLEDALRDLQRSFEDFQRRHNGNLPSTVPGLIIDAQVRALLLDWLAADGGKDETDAKVSVFELHDSEILPKQYVWLPFGMRGRGIQPQVR